MKTQLHDLCHEMGIPLLTPAPARWMLVDDNQAILETLGRMLSFVTDAEICAFSSPAAALAAFAAEPRAYDLVLTDFDMPGMCGAELCHSLRAICPSLHVVLMTGNTGITAADAHNEGFDAFLPKPFSMHTLQETLASVLAPREELQLVA